MKSAVSGGISEDTLGVYWKSIIAGVYQRIHYGSIGSLSSGGISEDTLRTGLSGGLLGGISEDTLRVYHVVY